MHRDRIPARARASHHETVSNPAWPVRGFRPPVPSGSPHIGNRRQSSCCCELLCHFFLKLSKVEISENLRFLVRIFPRGRFLLAVIVLPAGLDLSGRIETEQ